MNCHQCGKPVDAKALTQPFNKHPNKGIAFCSPSCRGRFDEEVANALRETLAGRKF